MFVSILNSYAEILTPQSGVMVLVDGAFGKCLNHEAGISSLIKGFRRSPAPPGMYEYNEKSATQKGALTLPCWYPDVPNQSSI